MRATGPAGTGRVGNPAVVVRVRSSLPAETYFAGPGVRTSNRPERAGATRTMLGKDAKPGGPDTAGYFIWRSDLSYASESSLDQLRSRHLFRSAVKILGINEAAGEHLLGVWQSCYVGFVARKTVVSD